MMLDADAAAIVRAYQQSDGPRPVGDADLAAVRAASDARRKQQTPSPLARVEDLTLQCRSGPMRARLYAPSQAPGLPVLVFFHGGGWVVCSIESHDELCRRLARASGWAFVSIEYPLAPEAKFPHTPEVCFEALCAVADAATSLKLDATRLAVGGDSSGGNLAIAVALLARARGGPSIAHQMLAYPPTDHAQNSVSYKECAEGGILTGEAMAWYWRQYLRTPADGNDPLASPLHADLAGMPAATIVTAEHDPLRDEAEAFASKLWLAAPATELRRFEGVMHGFLGMGGALAKADAAVAFLGERLREVGRSTRR